MPPTPLIAGNWKMFGRRDDLQEIAAIAHGVATCPGLEAAICPPVTLLAAAAGLAGLGPLRLGGQDCAAMLEDGAHTGDISARMLADAGASFCIIGHSERRRDHKESDQLVRAKVAAAAAAGLTPILCVGETLEEREAGKAEAVVAAQLAGGIPDAASRDLVIAYEPVWAIGTGRVAGVDDIAAMHAHIRRKLEGRFGASAHASRVLYGGSVKPSNAVEIFAIEGVNGALVGGASLKAANFLAIFRAHPAAAGH